MYFKTYLDHFLFYILSFIITSNKNKLFIINENEIQYINNVVVRKKSNNICLITYKNKKSQTKKEGTNALLHINGKTLQK